MPYYRIILAHRINKIEPVGMIIVTYSFAMINYISE